MRLLVAFVAFVASVALLRYLSVYKRPSFHRRPLNFCEKLIALSKDQYEVKTKLNKDKSEKSRKRRREQRSRQSKLRWQNLKRRQRQKKLQIC